MVAHGQTESHNPLLLKKSRHALSSFGLKSTEEKNTLTHEGQEALKRGSTIQEHAIVRDEYY